MTTKIIAIISFILFSITACFAQNISGTYYFPDKPFPQYMKLWDEGWSFKDKDGNKLIYAKPDMPLGGYIFIYYKNTTPKTLKITDIAINGIKMSDAITKAYEPVSVEQNYRSSILLAKLPKEKIDSLVRDGWPVWWKPEPSTIAPGEYGEIVVRMKRPVKQNNLTVRVISDNGSFDVMVSTKKAQPRFATISFTPDLETIYLYPSNQKSALKPVKVLIDGKNVTASSIISNDKTITLSPVIINLKQPLKWMSYHNYSVIYSDGSKAQAGIRSWGHDMVYGMWATENVQGDPKTALEKIVTEYTEHNINTIMPYVIGPAGNYFKTDAGWEYCEKMGMGRMETYPTAKHNATYLFAMDEPDATDADDDSLVAPEYRLGACGQYLVKWCDILHRHGNSPILLNIDNTYKPENWYTYHQLSDIPCVDPYYTEAQDFEDQTEPYFFPQHTRPTYVQAVAAISQSAGQPKPLHVILYSTRYEWKIRGRFPTPEEKRMEVYYAIAGGAKGLSFWWFPGIAERTPEGNVLWKEIGLLGAEVRTAGPVITTSCPVELPSTASQYLWVRSLLQGKDTIAIITVNNNAASDRLGTVVRPAKNANVSVKLPSWINPKDAFSITSDGIKNVSWKHSGNKVSINLGTLRLSSFVLVTSDKNLRLQLLKRYDEKFAANVTKLKAEPAK